MSAAYSLFTEWDEEAAQSTIARIASQCEIILRPYQSEAVEAVFSEWEEVDSTLVDMATGLGKSVIFSEVMRRWDVKNHGRILLIAHRKEMILQAMGHAKRAGISAAIEMAGNWACSKSDVVVASIDTLTALRRCPECSEGCDKCTDGKVRRFTRFDPDDFGLVTTDEGHHAVAPKFRKTFAWFEQNKRLKKLFVTATPNRSDKVGLHNVCKSVAYRMPLPLGIKEGWLVPIRQKFVTVESLDISQVDVTRGDLSEGQLQAAWLGTDKEEEVRLHAVVKPALLEANGEKTLVFATGKEHAKKLAACFRANGVRVECVIEDTPPSERERYIAEYRDGDLQVLVNCLVFCEGFDAPKTAVVVNCRMTKSESLLLQIVGRATRTLPGVVDGLATAHERRQAIAQSAKSHCVILDFVGNSGKHRLASVIDVLAGSSVGKIDIEEALAIAKKSGDTVDMEALAEQVKQARKEAKERAEKARRERLMTRTKADSADYHAVDVDMFDGEQFDYSGGEPKASKNQQYALRQMGVAKKRAKTITAREASSMIGKHIARTKTTWTGQISTAATHAELQSVGQRIKDFSEQYFVKKLLPELRKAWIQRRAELHGVTNDA
jgi:superfamily II DNA or RNA helicase